MNDDVKKLSEEFLAGLEDFAKTQKDARLYFKVQKGAKGCPADKPYGVVGERSGTVHGCHADAASAAKHLAAIYKATDPKGGYKPASKETRKFLETRKQHDKRVAGESKADEEISEEEIAADKYSIPQSVKNNAKRGLELHKKYGRGGTSVGMNTARILSAGGSIGIEKVRHINRYFPRHAGDNLDDKTSNGWIAWLLWGGDAGRRWAASIVKRVDGETK
jgi:hypothetical protein